MDPHFARLTEHALLWLPEHGLGYYPVPQDRSPYDQAYFDKYAGYAQTVMGHSITRFRVDLVNRYTQDVVLDVGIGCGAFIEARNATGCRTLGDDVNPAGLAWLRERGLHCDWQQAEALHAITLWDVLEHLPDPEPLLRRVERFVFASLPIFESAEHVVWSRHFRRDEHCWYFTREGFLKWMAGHGFACRETLLDESRLGRESIETFVCERVCGP